MFPAARLVSLFSAAARSRGAAYYRQGRIHLASQSDAEIAAVVSGTQDYDVRLRKEDATLLLSCQCPFFLDGSACKHLYGTLLAAEADPALHTWPGWNAARIRLDRSSARAQTVEPAERFLEYRRRRALAGAPAGSHPDHDDRFARGRAGRDADEAEMSLAWRAPLDRIRDAMSRADALEASGDEIFPEQIVYLVDEAASLAYGDLTVNILRRERKRNGEWGKPKPLGIRRSQVALLPDENDRRLIALALGSADLSYLDVPVSPQVHVPPILAITLLPLLCASDRLFLSRDRSVNSSSLSWDDGPAWTLRLEVAKAGENGAPRYALTGWLVRGTERLALSAPRLITPTLAFFPDNVARFDPGDAWSWIPELRGNRSITVPASQASTLIDTLFTLRHVPPVDLPDELRIEERTPDPTPCLRLSNTDRSRRHATAITAELSFDYGGTVLPAAERRALVYLPEERAVVRRRPLFERRARRFLHHLGFRQEADASFRDQALSVRPQLVPHAVRDLLAAGWRVEADGRLYRPAGRSHMSVKTGIDWFELHGEAEFDDQVATLPQLLRALARGERVVTLGDGSLGLLPEEWLRRFAGISDLGTAEGNHIRFRPTQVAVLDALLAAQWDNAATPSETDEAFERARHVLRQFEAVAPLDPPPTFAGELRAYQREGLGWLEFLRALGFGGCLADDMGLGKTVMVLALLERRRTAGATRPSLVVAPRSVVFNWLREATRFTPQLRVADYTGPNRAELLARLDELDLLVTTYGILRQDAPRLKGVEFEYAVLDESQAIKNAATASAKAARLLNAAHRLALSGTPIENHVGELWSLFDFLNPGMLGARAFRRKAIGTTAPASPHAEPEENERGAADAEGSEATESAEPSRAAGEPAGPNDARESLDLLARTVRPFILRRTKEQVAPDLPERQEETIWCELEGADRRRYDELRQHYRSTLIGAIEKRGLERSRLQVLEALLRLRQAACHPGLLDRARVGVTGAKLDALLPQLAELREEGHKALVFSQFTSLLAIIRRHMDEAGMPYEYLDGRTRDREARVSRFQERGDCPFFLISLKAGGLGLNLTAADYVFLLDPWWNPAAEAQAIDRAHRIGQTRPVFAYRLIARDTVEERILELQQQKRELADAIVSADNSLVATLTREELEALLS